MNNVLKIKDEETADNVLPFVRPATGGKGPPGSELGLVWLKDLPEGAVFLAKDKRSGDPYLGQFLLLIRLFNEEATYLRHTTPTNQEIYMWVSTKEFSRKYEYVGTLQILASNEEQSSKEEDQKKEEDDGTINRTLSEGVLENLTDAQEVNISNETDG